MFFFDLDLRNAQLLKIWQESGKIVPSGNFEWVDTGKYEIKPKKDYLKRKLTEKEEELKRFEAARDNSLKYYEGIIGKISTEIEELKGKT